MPQGGVGTPLTQGGGGGGPPWHNQWGGGGSYPSQVRRGTHPPSFTGPELYSIDGADRDMLCRAPVRWGGGYPSY